MAKNEDKIKMTGVVTDVSTNMMCKVKLENGIEITAYPAGKLRMNSIRILPMDVVQVEISVYDLSKGRIVYRLTYYRREASRRRNRRIHKVFQ